MDQVHLSLVSAVLAARQELKRVTEILNGVYTNPRNEIINLNDPQTSGLVKKVAQCVFVTRATLNVSEEILSWLAEMPKDENFAGSFSAALESQLHVVASAAAFVLEATDRHDRWLAQPSVLANLANSNDGGAIPQPQ